MSTIKNIITLNCCLIGEQTVDATDISRVWKGKNNYAWVEMKTGSQFETTEQYPAVVKKWKDAL